MPPFNPAALAALQGLDSNVQNNPTAQLYLSRNKERQQLVDSIQQAQMRQDPAALAGLKTGLTDLDAQQAESPITTQGAQVDKQRAMLSDAINQGFGANTTNNPRGIDPVQAFNLDKQRSEDEKLRMPLQQEQVRAQGGIKQQEIQSQGQRDVASIGAGAKAQGYDILQNMLNGKGIAPGSTVSVSGAGSVHTPTTPNANLNPLLTKLSTDRGLAQQATNGKWSWSGTTQAEAMLKQDLNNILMVHPASPETKQFVAGALSHPEYEQLPLEQILAKEGYQPTPDGGYTHQDGTIVSPQDKLEAEELFRTLRGF